MYLSQILQDYNMFYDLVNLFFSLRPNRNIDRDKILEHISTSKDIKSVKALDEKVDSEDSEDMN